MLESASRPAGLIVSPIPQTRCLVARLAGCLSDLFIGATRSFSHPMADTAYGLSDFATDTACGLSNFVTGTAYSLSDFVTGAAAGLSNRTFGFSEPCPCGWVK